MSSEQIDCWPEASPGKKDKKAYEQNRYHEHCFQPDCNALQKESLCLRTAVKTSKLLAPSFRPAVQQLQIGKQACFVD